VYSPEHGQFFWTGAGEKTFWTGNRDMTYDEQVYSDYLRDLGLLVREYALEAKRHQAEAATPFMDGYLSGFHRIVSLMQQQAEAFGLPPEAIGLDGIDPEVDLV